MDHKTSLEKSLKDHKTHLEKAIKEQMVAISQMLNRTEVVLMNGTQVLIIDAIRQSELGSEFQDRKFPLSKK
jgi:hypothetical protein